MPPPLQTIHKSESSMTMRRNRIIWACLWVLSCVAISIKGGAVTYGAFAVLTLIPIVSFLYLMGVYALFHLYQELEQRFVSVGTPVLYRFVLVNEYPLQFAGIRVRYFSSFSSITDLDDETEYELSPGARIEKETKLICRYRGEYKVGIKEIEIQDFFRLFKIRYKNKECIRAVVKPQLVKIDRLGGIDLSDAVKRQGRDRSERDILSRSYVPGDDRRYINWSQTARTGQLMTRDLTGSEHQEIAIITDGLRYSDDDMVYLPAENKVLEAVLALAYHYARNGISAAEYHIGQGMERIAVEDTRRFEEFYDVVSEIRFSELETHQRLYDAVMSRREIFDSAMVFFVTSSWDAVTDALLKQLEVNGPDVVVCYITDNEDSRPDLSDHRSCGLVIVSPYAPLTKEPGS